jgi:hypothetical protein
MCTTEPGGLRYFRFNPLRGPNGEAIWPWEFGALPQTPKTKTLKRFGSASLPAKRRFYRKTCHYFS